MRRGRTMRLGPKGQPSPTGVSLLGVACLETWQRIEWMRRPSARAVHCIHPRAFWSGEQSIGVRVIISAELDALS